MTVDERLRRSEIILLHLHETIHALGDIIVVMACEVNKLVKNAKIDVDPALAAALAEHHAKVEKVKAAMAAQTAP